MDKKARAMLKVPKIAMLKAETSYCANHARAYY